MRSVTEATRKHEFSHYDAVSQLDEQALRALLKDGRPSEKVWAAWHLALVAGAGADPALTDAITDEPTAGVRAHWVIVLFSHQEHDLVAVLAQYDPSALVRETAARYLAPIAHRSTLGVTLAACLTDRSSRVRQTTVRHLSPAPGEGLLSRVFSMVEDGDPQVRMAALEYILAHHSGALKEVRAYASDPDVHVRRRAIDALADSESTETDWALDRLLVETDEAARDRLTSRLLEAGRDAEMAQGLAEGAPLAIHDVFAPLARAERRFPWAVMAPLFGSCPDSPTLLVLCACLDTETIPEGSAVALIDEATAYYEGEELWLPHLIQITRPLLDSLAPERRAGFPALRALLADELVAARAQRWGPIDTLESLLAMLPE